MRWMMQVAAAIIVLAAGPAHADNQNYNGNSAGNTNNDGNANCNSSTMLGGCSESVTEAPLPLLGAGIIGAILLGGAGTASVLIRRRRERHEA